MHASRVTLRGRSRKQRPATELLCEYVFRPLAHLVVLALLPMRVPPPAVVFASASVGLAAAAAIAGGNLVAAALLLQLKTVLDNADGQLARASGRVSPLGRYLDSESDLVVNAAVFAALGYQTGEAWLALAAFVVLTLVLSADFNLERLNRRARGDDVEAMPRAEGAGALLAAVYRIVYAPHDRLIEGLVESRLRRLRTDAAARLAYHDLGTLAVLANLGLSTQLAVLGLFLALGEPRAYLWVVFGCGVAVILLAARRELRARSSLRRTRRPEATAPSSAYLET